MTFAAVKEVGAICGVIVAVIAALGAMWKVLRTAMRVDNALPTLLAIAEEFSPNHGSSLRDQVDAIRKNQDEVKKALGVVQDSTTAWSSDHDAVDEARFEVIAQAATAAGWDMKMPSKDAILKSKS